MGWQIKREGYGTVYVEQSLDIEWEYATVCYRSHFQTLTEISVYNKIYTFRYIYYQGMSMGPPLSLYSNEGV